MQSRLKIFIAVLLSAFSFSVFAEQDHFAIYVDAGSSGSRLHIIQYHNSGSMPSVQDVISYNVTPGLSSFIKNPTDAGPSLEGMLYQAENYLNGKTDLSTVPVNVMGTAGMRLLTDQQQANIYQSVTASVAKTDFGKGFIGTIEGKMEGLYGWLDVNYLEGNFQNHQPTVGSIDMGGGSTQIAFVPDKNIKSDDLVTVNINDQQYVVFSKSFLGLGQDAFRDSMMESASASKCFPTHYVFAPSRVGAFNFAECTPIYKEMLATRKIAQQILPVKGQTFIAYSGIYYTWNFFNVDKTSDESAIVNAASTVCNNETWEQMQKAYPTVKPKYIMAYCSNAAYSDELLYKTYGLQGSQFKVLNQIGDTGIDWPLGAALYNLVK